MSVNVENDIGPIKHMSNKTIIFQQGGGGMVTKGLTQKKLDEMNELSKLDNHIIVGSDIRILVQVIESMHGALKLIHELGFNPKIERQMDYVDVAYDALLPDG